MTVYQVHHHAQLHTFLHFLAQIQIFFFLQGTCSDIVIRAEEITRLKRRLNEIYVHHTGMSYDVSASSLLIGKMNIYFRKLRKPLTVIVSWAPTKLSSSDWSTKSRLTTDQCHQIKICVFLVHNWSLVDDFFLFSFLYLNFHWKIINFLTTKNRCSTL